MSRSPAVAASRPLETRHRRGERDENQPRKRSTEGVAIARRKRPPAEPVKPQGPRVNEQIRISPVRLIGDQGEQIGVVELGEAMMHARDRGLDLVEVSPKARPVVCKLMDYGKFKYEQKKKDQQAKRKEKNIHIKTVRFRPNIEQHDFETKARRATRFLLDGDKVKVDVLFRRREMRQIDNGKKILSRIAEETIEFAKVENREDAMPGNARSMSMLLTPIPGKIEVVKARLKKQGIVLPDPVDDDDDDLDDLDDSGAESAVTDADDAADGESTEAESAAEGGGDEAPAEKVEEEKVEEEKAEEEKADA